jgi:hypothetical protein
MELQYYIALDLGPASESTACAVLEQSAAPEKEPVYALRHLHRFALGTPYAKIIPHLASLLECLPSARRPTLLVDQTGVGRPVFDMIRRARLAATLLPVLITSGQEASLPEDECLRVPKVELVSCLQILLQARRLRVPRNLPEALVLARELQNFRIKVTLAANDAGTWRENKHDDLVLAVALACWRAESKPAVQWGTPSKFQGILGQVPPGVFSV